MNKKIDRSPVGITEQQVAEMRSRYAAGESATALGKVFGLSGSSVSYHIHKAGHVAKTNGKAPPAKVPTPKKHKFIDMPVSEPSEKVAIILTDRKNLAAVLGGLWK